MAHTPLSLALNGRDFTPTDLAYRFYPQRVSQVCGAPRKPRAPTKLFSNLHLQQAAPSSPC